MSSGVLGLAQLLFGSTAVLCAGGLVVASLRIQSAVAFVLGTYLVSWALVVGLCLVLSPTESLTTASALVGSLVLLAAAALAWQLTGRRAPPAPGPAVTAVRDALRDRLAAALVVVVSIAFAYSVALAFLTPINDGDALAYHVARAAFWRQAGGVGYVGHAVDSRINGSPPDAEIGMLFTMLLAGSDRFVALPQLIAFPVTLVCVVGLGRRAGLDDRAAMFGALLFGCIPVVILQASTGLNDLVVAAFLGAASYFALRPGRSDLVLFGLGIALAVGTKFTAFVAMPAILLVVLVGRPRREWPWVAVAGLVGTAVGSLWFAVNEIETGSLDGGLANDFAQRADASPAAIAVTHLRLLLDVVDLSGTPGSYVWAYVVGGAGILLLAALLRVRGKRVRTLVVAALLVATPILIHRVFVHAQDFVFHTWAALGRPPTPDFELGWNLNVVADPALSWFGPLGLLLFVGLAITLALWRRGRASALLGTFALAPFVLLWMLSVLVVYDPFRGRLLIFGVALAAVTWGLLLRWRALAVATATVASVAAIASLLNYQGKASGISALVNAPSPFHVSTQSVWNARRPSVQARPRPDTSEPVVFPFVDRAIPAHATVALAPRVNDFISPYFGPHLSREVLLVRTGGVVPPRADWLVMSPSTQVVRCRRAWRRELALDTGWRIERRVAPDTC